MKILAGTDFSASGDDAVRCAAALCRGLGAALHIASAYEPLAARGLVTSGEGALELDRQLRSLVEAGLRETVERCSVGALDPQLLPLEGEASEALASAAAELSADLLVVGSHGHSALGRFVLGSVADRLVEHAPCPVLVLHGTPDRFERWLEEERPLRVVVGADLSRATTAAIALVRTLRERTAVDLTFVHVYWPPVEYERLGFDDVGPLDLPDPELAQSLETALEKRIGVLPGTGRQEIRVWPGMGGIGRALDHEAELMDADLVVVGTRQRRGLARLWRGSHAREVLHHVRRPVACVPQQVLTRHPEPVRPPRTLLVGTDLSEHGTWAVQHALALAPPGARLWVVHVLPRSQADDQESIEAELRTRFEDEAAARGVALQVEVVVGDDPAAALLAAAERAEADLMVLGSHGGGGLRRALLGSVTKAVVRAAKRPVYVVPAPEEA